MSSSKSGTEVDVQAVLACSTFQYFIERDSAAFLALLAKSLKLGSYKFADAWQDGGSIFVKLVTKPDIASWVPNSVRNAVSNSNEIEFHDIIEYNPALIQGPTYTLHVRTESPFLGDKLDVQTTLTFSPLSETSTLQRLHGYVSVRMFGVGRFIEKAIRDNLIKTYSQLPGIIARWEAYRGEVVRNGQAGVLLAGRPPVGGDMEYIRTVMQLPLHEEPSELEKLALESYTSGALAGAAAAAEREEEMLQEAPVQKRKHEEVFKWAEESAQTVSTEKPHLQTPTAGAAGQPAVPKHVRRRTAESIILDAFQPLGSPGELQNPFVAYHRRGLSIDSVGSEGSDAPTELELRTPGTRGARTAWKRFNRDYQHWEKYWVEVGVKAASAAQQGVLRVLVPLWQGIVDFIRLLMIVLLLGFVRIGLLKVIPKSRKLLSKGNGPHRRTASAPPPKSRSDASLPRSPYFSHAHHRSAPAEPGLNPTTPSRFYQSAVAEAAAEQRQQQKERNGVKMYPKPPENNSNGILQSPTSPTSSASDEVEQIGETRAVLRAPVVETMHRSDSEGTTIRKRTWFRRNSN